MAYSCVTPSPVCEAEPRQAWTGGASTAAAFTKQLIDRGWWTSDGLPGVYGFSREYRRLREGLARLVLGFEASVDDSLAFAPVSSRAALTQAGYFRKFAPLLGTVHSFCGDEGQHWAAAGQLERGEGGVQHQDVTDLALTPAACYPLYAVLSARGSVAAAGTLHHVVTPCFRQEPSWDSTRLRSFEMQEFVFVGGASDAEAFRTRAMAAAPAWLQALGLAGMLAPANDAFFGRSEPLMRRSQRDRALKFELLIDVFAQEPPVAVMSFNLHLDHMGRSFDLRLANGCTAHSACVGFGMDRLAVAVLARHGFDAGGWPCALVAALEVIR